MPVKVKQINEYLFSDTVQSVHRQRNVTVTDRTVISTKVRVDQKFVSSFSQD